MLRLLLLPPFLRTLGLSLALSFSLLFAVGCNQSSPESLDAFLGEPKEDEEPPQIRLTFDPPTYDFGPLLTTATSPLSKSVTVKNESGSLVHIASVAGTSSPHFTLSSETCSTLPEGLANGETCSLVVLFKPIASGLHNYAVNFTFSVTEGGTDLSGSVNFLGTGQVPANLLISDGPTFDFGDVVATASVDKNFIVTNNGDVPATTIIAAGLAAPFSYKGGTYPGTGGTCSATLAATQSCTIVVTFNPSTTGLQTATMTLGYNNGDTTTSASRDMQGTGATPASLTISDSPGWDYGTYAVGASVDRTFTLTNTGGVSATVVTGSGLAVPFSFKGGNFPGTGGTCGATLAKAGSCTFVVTYSPAVTGGAVDSIEVGYFDGLNSQTASRAVQGTAVPPASITISDGPTFDYGQRVTTSSTDQTFTLNNTGGFNASFMNGQGLAAPFAFKGGTYPGTGGNCSINLAAGSSCTIVVTYNPTVAGSFSDSIEINYVNGATSVVATRAVQGVAVTPANLQISDGPTFNFGTRPTGGSTDHTFTVTNTGGIQATTILGSGLAAPFTFKGGSFPGTGGNCSVTLNPAASCTFVVTYAPITTGPNTDTVDLSYNNGLGTVNSTRDLSATAVGPAVLSLSDGPFFDYGTQPIGKSIDKTITVTNTGGFQASSINGSGLAAPFSFKGGSYPGTGGTCTANLNAGASCTFIVTYQVAAAVGSADTVDISYNDGVNPQTSSRDLQGTGVTPASLSISDGPTYDYGPIATGGSAERTFTVTNTGTFTASSLAGSGLAAPFTFKGGTYPGTGGSCSTTLAGGATCTIIVVFAPTATGNQSDVLDVSYDDGVNPQTSSRTLQGVGTLPATITITDGPTYNYGSIPYGATATKSFTLTNVGGVTASSMAGLGLAAPYTFLGGSYPGTGGNCGTTLAASANCTIVVQFAPTIAGTFNDAIDINYFDTVASQTSSRAITGTGVDPANLVISNGPVYDYLTVAVGGFRDFTFTVTNSGQFGATTITGGGLALPYSYKGGTYPGTGGSCSTSLAAGANCTIVVTFSPSGTGAASDTIELNYNNGAAGVMSSRGVQGTGAAPATLTISDPPSFDYGTYAAGSSGDKTFSINNTGGVTAENMSGSGLAAPFSFKGGSYPGTGGTCTASLAAGGSCTVVVTYAPTVAGSQGDTIEINYDNGAVAGQQVTRVISGTAVNPAVLSFSDGPTYDFGSIPNTGAAEKIFTVTNSGNFTASVMTGGGLAAPFTFKGGTYPGVGGNCGPTLAPAATCTVVIRFNPTTLGAHSDNVELAYFDGAANQNAMVGVQGTSAPPGNITISDGPGAYDFGTWPNGAVREYSFTLTNTGGVPATSITGSGLAAPYSFKGGSYPGTGGTCGGTLGAAVTCTIVVQYSPTALGASSDIIQIDYNDGLIAQVSTRTIQGTAVPPAVLAISDGATFDFNTVAVGASAEKTFIITNTGGFAANSISGTGLASPFSFKGGSFPGTGGTCTNNLATGGTCTIVVVYAPLSTGLQSDTIDINYNDGVGAQVAQRPIQGTGATPAILTVSDGATFDFGSTAVGLPVDKSFTLTNSGGVTATSVAGAGLAAPFTFKGGTFPGTGGNCGTSLAASGSCTFVVTFSPAGVSTPSDTIEIGYFDAVNSQTATRPIQGQGVAPANLLISDGPTYNFSTRANGSSTDVTLTVTNSGSWPASSMAGTGLAAPFSFKGGTYPGSGGTCGSSMASGASCTIVVTFAPTSSGVQSDDVVIDYNNGASAVQSTRGVQGTGAPPASLTLSDGPTFDFLTKATGSSTDKTITVTNGGGVPATGMGGSGLAAPFTFKGGSYPGSGGDCGLTLNAGASCNIMITYDPTGTGLHTDTIEVAYNDGVAGQTAARNIQGTGAAPAAFTISDGPTFDYGTIAVGGSSDKSFTINNTGGVPGTSVTGSGLAAPFTFKGGTFPGTGGSCSNTINAGASCTVVVTFAPTVGGVQSDVMDIDFNNGVSAQTASRSITGTAVTPANLVISDGATFDFGTVPATSTNDKVFTVNNIGTLSATSIVGSGLAAPFTFKGGTYPGTGGTCGASLNGGSTCTIVVTFNPTANGGFSDTIVLDYYDGAGSQTSSRPVQGTGAPPANLGLSGGPTYNFGNIANTGSADATLTLTNSGGVTATSIVGAGLVAPYSYKGGSYPGTGGTCTTSLVATGTCTIVVTFNPTSLGLATDTIEIDYFNGLSSQQATRPVSGTSVNPAALSFSDAPTYDYGTKATGSTTGRTITITNTGDVTATTMSGSGLAAPFTFAGGSYPGTGGNCSTTLNPAASCTIRVNYAPTGTGSQSDTIDINFYNGASSTSASMNVQGTGAAPADLTITDGPLYSYGTLAQGGTADRTFTLTNIGGVSATAMSGGGLAAPFTFKGGGYPGTGGNCTTSLVAGGNCTIVVTYNPTNIASHSDTIEVSFNDEVTTQTVTRNIAGVSVAPASITISDGATFNYGLVANTASVDKTFTLTNAGAFQATAMSGGGLAAPFSFKGGTYPGTGGNCGTNLAAGATCTVVVTFSPTVSGLFNDSIEISYNDGSSVQNSPRAVQGTGAPPALLAVSETGSYDYGTQATGSTNDKTFTITNSGGVDATSVAGTGLAAPFSFKGGTFPGTGGSCTATIAASATCNIVVTFAPTGTGAASDTIEINYNDGVTGTSATRGVQGVGATPASLAISDPVTYSYGSIANGGVAEKSFTVTNSGGVTAASMAGAGISSPFFFKGGSYPGTGGTCGGTLGASGTCTMVVTFQPSLAGLQSDTIELNYNDGVTTQQATRPVEGTGVTPAIINITDGPTFDYGPVVATTSADKTFTVSNSGSLTATTLNGSGLAAPFSFKGGSYPGTGGNCSISLNPGASCTIVVTFNPTVTGSFSDIVDMTYFDGANNQTSSRNIQGTGATPANLTISGSGTFGFGILAQNGSADQTFTITNGGGVPATSVAGAGLAAPYTYKGGSFPGSGGNCGTSLAAAASCTIVVNFNPTTIAVHNDTIEINYNDGLGAQTALRPLTGEAVAPANLSLSDGPTYDYATVATGATVDKTFTVTNSGNFTASSLAGAGLAAPFTFKGGLFPGTGGNCTTTLNASASCTIVVSFAPTGTGLQSDTVEINYNNGASGQQATVGVQGTGATPASLAISDTEPYDYGTRANGSATDRSFTITNSGGVPATGLGGSGLATPFTFKGGTYPGTGGNCSTSLAATGTCTVVVTFSPTVSGLATDTMDITFNNGVTAGNTVSRGVQGTGANPAVLAISDATTFNFGLKANGSTTDKLFTITNTGNFTATVMSGTGLVAPYSYKGGSYPGTGGNCSTTLAAAGTCTIEVTFAPTITGTHNDTIEIPYNDGAGNQTSLRDVTGTSAPPAVLAISDVGFDFGTRATGSSTDKIFTINNTGGVDAIGVSAGGLAAPYTFKGGSYPGTGGNCGGTIASAASCTVVVTYAPTGTGVHNDTIEFTYNDGVNAAQTSNRAITGTGASPATITISETGTWNYGSIATGGNADKTFTLTNTGGVPATSVTGSGLVAPFTFKGGTFPGTGGNCTATLNAAATCDIVVTFAPTVGGLQSDTIEIGYNDGVTGQTSTRGVQGTGVTPANLTISDGVTFDYGPVVQTGTRDKIFTVTNSGDLSATVMSGTGLVAPYSFKGGTYPGTGGDCGPTLAGANTTCTIVVTFNPSTTGSFSDTIEIPYYNGVTTLTASRPVQGTGATPAALALSGAGTLNFGVLANGGTGDLTVTVSNTGGVPATSVTGSGLSAPFSFKGGSFPGTGGNCTGTIAIAGSCDVVLNYSPTAIATHNGTVNINFNDGLGAQVSAKPVTGQAVAPAVLAISDPGYDFGVRPTGGTTERSFTITNNGSFTASSMAGGGLAAPYAFKGGTYPGTGGNCGTTLAPAATCTVVVTFAPTGTGVQADTIEISYNDGANAQTANRAITGTGAAPALLTLSDSDPYNYGTRANGSNTDRTFVLTNSGGVDATSIGGSGLAAPFTFKGGTFPGAGGTCTASLSASSTCNIVVTFSPTVAGVANDTMIISYNDGVNSQSASRDLTGTGANPAVLDISDAATFNFGLKANGSSTDKIFTVTNNGNFSATAMSGTGLVAPYSYKGGGYPGTGGNCSTTLAASGSCTIEVTFAPTITGTHNDTIELPYNDGASSQTSLRDVTGTSAPPAVLAISDVGFSYGTVATGAAVDKTFTINNTGGVDAIGVSAGGLAAPYTFKGGSYPGTGGNCGGTIASAASCTIVVTYSPTGTGTQNDTIEFTYNDGVTASQTSNRAITGVGASPATITISETGTWDYGSVATGGLSDKTFTLTNTGGVPATGVGGSGLAAPFTFKGGTFPGSSGGNCTTTLNPGATCDIVVTFAPTVGGLQSDTIEIGYTDGVTTQTSTRGVQGTGVTPANLAISDGAIFNYGPVIQNGTMDKAFTITNSGDQTATTIGGSGLAAPFSFKGGSYPGVGGTCTTTLSGGNTTCTIVVSFNPTALGPQSDTIDITYNSGAGTPTASRDVQGTGATPAVLALSGAGTLDFGLLAQGGTGDTTVTISNTGGVPATSVAGVGLSAPFSFKGGSFPGSGGTCTGTIAVAGNCTMILSYSPTTIATHNGTVSVNYVDGLNAQSSSKPVTGQAVAPASITISDAGYDYGVIPTGGTAERAFTVNNGGGFSASSLGGGGLAAPYAFKGGTYPGTGGNCGTTLAAGSSCTIVVTFAPTGTGVQGDTIEMSYNDGAGAQVANRAVTGTGATPALLTLSDTDPYDFSTRATGSSTDRTFVLTNSGGVNATGIGGSGLAAPYSFKGGSFPGTGGNCTTSLTPASNCNIVVTYNPTVAGATSDTMDIAYNNGVSGQTVSRSMQGTGATPAVLGISDGLTFNFGLRANGSSTDKTFTVTNTGNFTSSSMTGGGLAAPYTFKGGSYPGGGGNCSTTLAPAGTCTIVVTFAPTGSGTHNDTVEVNYNDGATAQVSQRDITGSSAAPAVLNISDAGFDFGTRATGSSNDKSFTVDNSGGVDAISVSAAGLAAPYTFKGGTYPGTGGSCGGTIAAGANCTVVVTYAPTGTGVHNDTIEFTYNDGVTVSQTSNRAITGTGATPATITISETGTWDYGSIATGGSADKLFTLTNTGGIQATSVGGSGLAAPFTFRGGSFPGTGGGNCGTTLNAGASCDIVVTFAPTVGGLQSDTIEIGYNDGVTTQTSTRGVQGTGVTPANLTISDGATFNYGPVVQNGTVDKAFTITNTGDQTATSIGGSGLAAPFSFKGGSFPGAGGTCTTSLTGAGNTCTIVVSFNPTGLGLASDTIDIGYNSGAGTPTVSRDVQGTGASPASITISGANPYDFGVVAQGSLNDASLTLTNAGGVLATSLGGSGLSAPYTFKGGSFPGSGGSCTGTLAVGGTCTVVINYSPTTIATHGGTMSINFNDGLTTQASTRPVTGQAVAPANLTISDVGFDFGVLATGGTLEKTFTVNNTGSFAASSVTGSGLAAPYSFKGGTYPGTGGNCNTSLAAGGSCTIVVVFNPSGTGAQNDTIEVGYNDGAGAQTALRAITGTGAAPANLTLSGSDPHDFGTRAVGSATDVTFTVNNTGGVTATSVSSSGLAAPINFKGGTYPGTGGTCGGTLGSGANCTVVVTYSPAGTGSHSRTLSLNFNDGVVPDSVTKVINGTGANAATISISDSDPYNYGVVATGGTTERSFTLSNTGGVAAGSLAVSGLAAPYELKGGSFPGVGGTCTTTLNAGSNCTIVVTFAPTGTGVQSDTISVDFYNGVTTTSSTRDVTGTGANPASLAVSESGTYDYGTVAQGSNNDWTFTVTNSGGVVATSLAGVGLAAPFTFKGGVYPGTGGNCGGTLGIGAACTVVVTYSPTGLGTQSDQLDMTYYTGASSATASRPIQGTAVAAALLTINLGATYNFGTLANGASAEVTFTVNNGGGVAATGMASTSLAAPFSYKGGAYPGTGGSCTTSLAAAGSCTVIVVFAPTGSGSHSDSIDIDYNDGAGSAQANRAVAGTSSDPATITISDGPTYDYLTVATTGFRDRSFTINNTGGVPATAVGGSGLAAPFTFKGGSFPGTGGNCGGTIGAGGSCTVVVTFAPTAVATYNGTLGINFNDGVGAQTSNRPLTGAGALPAVLAITDFPTYDYNTVATGGTAERSFTVSNSGGIAATSLVINGLASPFDFKDGVYPGTGGNCGTSIPAAGSCTVVVTFAPGSTGLQNDTLALQYNDGATTQSFGLDLQGVGANPANITISDAGFDYGFRANGGSTDKTFTLNNTGGVAATSVAGGGLAAPYAFKGGTYAGTGGTCTTSLAAGASCTIVVTFSPVSTGTHNDTIEITYANGVTTTSSNRAITGSSDAPAVLGISDGPGNYDFGTQLTASTTEKIFTLSNTGSFTASTIAGTGLDGAPFLYKGGTFPGTGTTGICGTTLAPGSSCSFEVLFQPATANTYNDTVEVTYNNGASIQSATRGVDGVAITPVPPSEPGNPVITIGTGGFSRLQVTWTGSTMGTAPITYGVERSTTSGTSGFASVVSGLSGVEYLDTAVTAGTTYYYRITATGPGGGTTSVSSSAGIPMGSFTFSSATPGDGSVQVAFTASTGATSYNVRYGLGTLLNNVLTGGTSGVFITPLTHGSSYNFQIVAVNAYGEVTSGTIGAIPFSAPIKISKGPLTDSYCVVMSNGELRCWGHGAYGILGDGAEAAYGDDTEEVGSTSPQLQVGTSAISQIFTGPAAQHICAKLQNNRVKCWGRNHWGQLGLGDRVARGGTADTIGENLSYVNVGTGRTVTKMALGEYHTCALTDTNEVLCFGRNDFGQLGYNSAPPAAFGTLGTQTGDFLTPVSLGTGTIADIVAGQYFNCIRYDYGGVRCWGRNDQGQLGRGNNAGANANIGDAAGEVAAINDINLGTDLRAAEITAGQSHVCVRLIDDGPGNPLTNSVKCWGDGAAGKMLNEGTADYGNDEAVSTLPTINLGTGTTAVRVAAGMDHTCVINHQGDLMCWGNNSEGELGIEVTGGANTNIGDAVGERPRVVNFHSPAPDLVDLSLGENVTCARTSTGLTKCWGQSDEGQLGNADDTLSNIGDGAEMGNTLGYIDAGGSVAVTIASRDNICHLRTDNIGVCYGSNGYGRALQGTKAHKGDDPEEMGSYMTAVDLGAYTVKDVAMSGQHACAILNTDEVKCWGRNNYGQLGYGDYVNRNTVAQMGSLTTVNLGPGMTAKALALGTSHTCAILNDDSVKCWGRNNAGQLGINNAVTEPAPLVSPVSFGTLGLSAKKITAGAAFTCVVRMDDSVRCWGSNSNGQIGSGANGGGNANYGDAAGEMTTVGTLAMALGTTAIDVQAGNVNTCALLTGGTVKCWGEGGQGRRGSGDQVDIGDNENLSGLAAINFGGLIVTKMTVGNAHSCYHFTDNTMKCIGVGTSGRTGHNNQNAIGDAGGETNGAVANTLIGPGRYPLDFSATNQSTCVIADDYQIRCFGDNRFGQLGIESTDNIGDAGTEMDAALNITDVW